MQPIRRPMAQFINRALNQSRYSSTSGEPVTREFEEITIPVPWGHIAGKWYGPKHVRPLVGLHGWMHNAGAFDQMAPLLPQHISFLTLDMPGHGLSSWMPDGCAYHTVDFVTLLLRVMKAYNWDKISLMGHSMSALNGYVFAALFPDKVDMFIGLDDIKPPEVNPKYLVDLFAQRLTAQVEMDQQQPPSYTWEELEERVFLAFDKEVDKAACKYLVKRNVTPSKHEPNKFFFSRDSRLKYGLVFSFSHRVTMEMARRIKCPHLFIKATEGHLWESQQNYDEALELLRQNPEFEYHRLPGTHYFHLNTPKPIANIVSNFIHKHRSQEAEASANKM